MMLKIMSGESYPDSDNRKTFRLITDVSDVDFRRRDDAAINMSSRAACKEAVRAHVTFTDGSEEAFPVLGTAFLMNDDGKTVAQFIPDKQ